MSIINAMHNFHFLRPLWLMALPLLWALVWWLARRHKNDGDWSSFIDTELLSALRLDTASVSGLRPWSVLALLWTVVVLALAGPSWERDLTEAYRAPADWIFVLDLSPSMAATDVSPTRVTRARYVLDDLLSEAKDARVGLVAFSDEAYTVTPLTQDVATVRALLPPLAPDIMPSPGDHLGPALLQAEKLLETAGNNDQRIVVLTDGFDDPSAVLSAAAKIRSHGVTLNVVGIGTASGAPMQNTEGQFSNDTQGRTKLTRLDTDKLKQLAHTGGGGYADISQVSGLINYLKATPHTTGESIAAQGIEVSHWRDDGVWLLPVLLILAGLLARRGWL
jgi:Ca-activated chloride channel family protein